MTLGLNLSYYLICNVFFLLCRRFFSLLCTFARLDSFMLSGYVKIKTCDSIQQKQKKNTKEMAKRGNATDSEWSEKRIAKSESKSNDGNEVKSKCFHRFLNGQWLLKAKITANWKLNDEKNGYETREYDAFVNVSCGNRKHWRKNESFAHHSGHVWASFIIKCIENVNEFIRLLCFVSIRQLDWWWKFRHHTSPWSIRSLRMLCTEIAITPSETIPPTKYLHSSQLSLPLRMQRFFLFWIQFSLHVKQNPLLVHVSHPVGHGIHSCRFLSP